MKPISHVRHLLSAVLMWPALCAAALNPSDVPTPLKSWIPWVLHEVRDAECPYLFNVELRQCVWPGRLELALTVQGGRFRAEVEVWGAGAWVPLPGGAGQWPQEVIVGTTPTAVQAREGVPSVELTAGRHVIEGEFAWPKLPEALQVPNAFALLTASVNGAPLDAREHAGNQLWLQPPQAASTPTNDSLTLTVVRLVRDEQPLQVTTRLLLSVAGAAREVRLRGAQLPDTQPLSIVSALPARLEPDGELRVQVKPGDWTLDVTTRHRAPVQALTLPTAVAPWPAEEVWSFEAQPALRLVTLEGAPSIDPRQTQVPPEWQSFPAYGMAATQTLTLKEERRGDPTPDPDQLTLHRTLWLDFDGQGFTVNDALSGRITRAWRLEAAPGYTLGQVKIDEQPQFITTLNNAPGVEVRRGELVLSADGRMEAARAAVPAIGWAQGVTSLSTTLNLPPGWRLWSAHGVDNVPETWLHRWTLLDIFLVLIATVAVGRLWHWRWAVVACLALLLLWHESGAPRQIWLHLLAAIALLRVLPTGRIRQFVNAYRLGALLVLAGMSVAFMVDHIRVSLYPQLLIPYPTVVAAMPAPMADAASSAGTESGPTADQMVVPENEAMSAAPREMVEHMKARVMEGADGAALLMSHEPKRFDAVASVSRDFDPDAQVQTGPGLPNWQWTSINLSWSGPVEPSQQLELSLLSPRVNLFLAALRVIFLLALIGLFAGAALPEVRQWTRGGALMWVPLLFALFSPTATHAALPDENLLNELKRRLLQAPECLPSCAQVPRLHATLEQDVLTLRFEVHAHQEVGIPLPGRAGQWLPTEVLLDGAPVAALARRDDAALWLALSSGVHEVLVRAHVPARPSFEVPFTLLPQRVTAQAQDWTVDGVKPDGGAESQLVFTRIATNKDVPAFEALESRALPPYFQVERTLRLGLEWRIETRVQRLTPPGVSAVLKIPLLEGEAVTTLDVRAQDGVAEVTLSAEQMDLAWDSTLRKREALTLTSSNTDDWREIWRADIAPLWHAELSGIPVVHHQSNEGHWFPQWQPWPGESVTINIARPPGVPGQTLTIDSSRLSLRPGERALEATLDFNLRSSRGGQHTLTLPADAELQTVAIDGVPQPIRQEGSVLTLPVEPRAAQIQLTWRETAPLTTKFHSPTFSLGTPSVNASIQLTWPPDRWTLMTRGPLLGPAVLFWGVLLVIVLVALALGRTTMTPLKTWQWLLLGVGLSQTTVISALWVVVWLFALGWRARQPAIAGKWRFNLVQVALVLLTLSALGMLFEAIQRGLLGTPDMQIAGNSSSAYEFNWYQDRIAQDYPVVSVWSVPLWVYRGLMLAWALWLAFALLGWLRWAWNAFAQGGIWRSVELFKGDAAKTAESASEPAPGIIQKE